jgi:hypothetical protein
MHITLRPSNFTSSCVLLKYIPSYEENGHLKNFIVTLLIVLKQYEQPKCSNWRNGFVNYNIFIILE